MAEAMALEKLLYSRAEAAQVLSISTVSLDRLVKHGELSTVRVGDRVLFNRDTLANFARRCGTKVTQ
jgi:excisionase family DNA binding protein